MRPRVFLVAAVILGLLATASVAFAAIEASASQSFDSVVVTRSIRSEPPNSPHLFHNIPNLAVNVADAIYSGPPVTCNFADFFENTKGVERWGFPTSEVYEEGKTGNLVQFYQRGAVGCRYQADAKTYLLQRVLVWDFFGGDAPGSVDQGVEPSIVSNQPGTMHGPWKHRVSNYDIDGKVTGFLDFFNRLGGVDSFGFPKTDARRDTNGAGMLNIPAATPGIVRQYFQAGVLESYPDNAGAPVQLRLLGDDLRDLQGLRDGAPFKAAAALKAGAAYAVVSLIQAPSYSVSAGAGKNIGAAFASLHNGATVIVNSGTSTVTLNGPAIFTVGGELIVPAGWTFDVNSGVTMRFIKDELLGQLTLVGTLDVDGTSGSRVQLISGLATPSNGDWVGIVMTTGSTPVINLDYADVLHGQNGIDARAIRSLTVSLNNVTIGAGNCPEVNALQECSGIRVDGTLSGAISNSTIAAEGYALLYYGIYANLSGLSFSGTNTIRAVAPNGEAFGIVGDITGSLSNLSIAVSGVSALGIFGTLSGPGSVNGVTINATSTTGSAYGIYGNTGPISNSTITASSSAGKAYGINGTTGPISNSTISP